MGNLYLFFRLLAIDVDQMMKPEITSSTASRVVTMIDRDPLIAAILTRTSNSTLHREISFRKFGLELNRLFDLALVAQQIQAQQGIGPYMLDAKESDIICRFLRSSASLTASPSYSPE